MMVQLQNEPNNGYCVNIKLYIGNNAILIKLNQEKQAVAGSVRQTGEADLDIELSWDYLPGVKQINLQVFQTQMFI